MLIKHAPIALFVYKRLDTLRQTISALQGNQYAGMSDLFVFSDGSKGEKDKDQVDDVRKYLHKISGFQSVNIIESKENKGLAQSIISGVSTVLEAHDSVIVLEDDLVTSPNFLVYMNSALEFYRNHERVFSISGFTFPFQIPESYSYDNYFHARACSWGWATWKNRWNNIDWKMLARVEEADLDHTRQLGSDFPSLVRKYKTGSIDSWAVPWCFYSLQKNYFCVYPTRSKVQNVGFDANATHTSYDAKHYSTMLDAGTQVQFHFKMDAGEDPRFTKQYLRKFSLFERFRWRVMKDVHRLVGI